MNPQFHEFSEAIPVCRYVLNGEASENILFWQPFPTRKPGEAIFKVIDDTIKKDHTDWTRCVGISADGTRATTDVSK
jgi:hypothetical protein